MVFAESPIAAQFLIDSDPVKSRRFHRSAVAERDRRSGPGPSGNRFPHARVQVGFAFQRVVESGFRSKEHIDS